MSIEDFRALASKVFEYTYYLQIPFGFEPLLHPQFDRVVEIADGYGIPNIGIVTNGTLLCGRNAEAILQAGSVKAVAISIDTTDRVSYEHIHGKDHMEQACENVAEFVRRKKAAGRDSLQVVVNATIERQSVEQLPEVLKWGVRVGADAVQFFHIEPLERSNSASVLGDPQGYDRIHGELAAIAHSSGIRVFMPPPLRDGDLDAAGRLVRRHTQEEESGPFGSPRSRGFALESSHPYPQGPFCVCPWMTWVIDSWGNVFPCAHRMEVPFSNILRDPMPKAFNSFRHLRLRRDHARGRAAGNCRLCRSKSPGSDPMRRKLTCLICPRESHLAAAREG